MIDRTRREFLRHGVLAAAMAAGGAFSTAVSTSDSTGSQSPSYFPALRRDVSPFAPTSVRAAAADEALPVAGVVTIYHRASHADVLLGKILAGFQQDGSAGPPLKLAALYVDQVGKNDLSRELSQRHGFPIVKSIDEALTLGGPDLKVAGVLSIAEHGDYPYTPDTKQCQYPRRKFFDEIVATFRRTGRTVPVFNDKHLSYRWADALHMVETAKKMDFPLLAGSSLPVAWRHTTEQLPRDVEIEAALSVGYGGFEAYGFHALENHQCQIERRRGGETGVVSVQAARRDEIPRAAEAGRWSRELLDAALAVLPRKKDLKPNWHDRDDVAIYLLTHRDGLRSSVVMANGVTDQFVFAAKIKGRSEPFVQWTRLQDGPPYGHFAYLLHAINHTVHARRAAYPVERTLLTTGVLDRVMQSLAAGGKSLDTPELDVRYTAADWPFANHPHSRLTLPL